jgi:hypothetical protein
MSPKLKCPCPKKSFSSLCHNFRSKSQKSTPFFFSSMSFPFWQNPNPINTHHNQHTKHTQFYPTTQFSEP